LTAVAATAVIKLSPMHLHIIGICGTFMGGLAAIARAAGHRVTGCDANVYPPMSTQLNALGIDLIEGYGADQLQLKPDVFVVGNVVTRGNALMEAILNAGAPYTSGPQWLAEHVLHSRWVLAVAGTHGKTTTTSMLAHILEVAGLNPGYLIGGVPMDFPSSARLTDSNFFVIEADEYDTAFFDKRSKFVHYRSRTTVLNNLEYDHADIFPDLAAIERQFHHLVRMLPSQGRVIVNGRDEALARVLALGCWSETEKFGVDLGWHLTQEGLVAFGGERFSSLVCALPGEHNRLNALAAIAAARHVGIHPKMSLEALASFQGVKRRMELRGTVRGVDVYDDFAHHPTAIATTVDGLRRAKPKGRILAVLEPRSNTMKLGAMKAALPESLRLADHTYVFQGAASWDVAGAFAPMGPRAETHTDLTALVSAVITRAQAGDHILVMSNGGFGGVHEKLLRALAAS
jgi:UDP-N-acetylmuramate: L-alanyl-gamma-D-glutamyl-meso-diaminopimelate ligase